MSGQEEIEVCLNCRFTTCCGADACPLLQLGSKKKSVKVSSLRKLLLAGYDPAEICFAVVEGTALIGGG